MDEVDVAAFATFLACFTKLSVKSSSAAKLFNAVHKAQVSWKRIRPLMKLVEEEEPCKVQQAGELQVSHVDLPTRLVDAFWKMCHLRRSPDRS